MNTPAIKSDPYDVRSTIPPHTCSGISDPPHAEQLYQQINVMIFLLGDIKLGTLYGNMKEWLPSVLDRVRNEWPEHPDFPTELQTLILDEGSRIQTTLNSIGGGVPFRPFWEQSVSSSVDPRRPIVEAFRRLAGDPQYGHCFCLPFLKFQPQQATDVVRGVPQDDMAKHVGDMKDETLLALYTKARKANVALAEAVGRGVKNGILSDTGGGIASIKGGGGNNNRICTAALGTCISHENTWCNTDANGSCTVAGG